MKVKFIVSPGPSEFAIIAVRASGASPKLPQREASTPRDPRREKLNYSETNLLKMRANILKVDTHG